LPYRDEVIEYISKAKDSGRDIYLLTAANQQIADSISKHNKIFVSVIGSDSELNIKGKNKLTAIQNIIGANDFDYIGDSRADVVIWQKAHTAIISGDKQKLANILKKDKVVILPISSTSFFKKWTKALRAHQWSKNGLLFLALFMSHRLLELNLFFQVVIAFISFSLSASAVYILNDLFDLEADRKHPSKKNRPFAAGHLSIAYGVFAIPVLLITSFILAINSLPNTFTVILTIYLITTTSYSLYFKEKLFLDVIILGALYTLRVLAGGLAVEVEVSSWLLGFSLFFFLSLAFMKRYADLLLIKNNDQEELFGRGYSVIDLDIVQKFGISSGFISLLILALYINGDQVMVLYKQPELIWLTIPILLYWLMRMWFVAHKGKMTDDPIVFALKDKISYIAFCFVIMVLVVAANLNISI
jgi:4-hydroxybenzoate polyprenyltransferase